MLSELVVRTNEEYRDTQNDHVVVFFLGHLCVGLFFVREKLTLQ